MSQPFETRAELVADLRTIAARVFAERPNYHSVTMGMAQFWNDQADDETHVQLLASSRETPLWSHVCDYGEAEPDPTLREHACGDCDGLVHLSFWGQGQYVAAVESFCHEHGTQSAEIGEAYLPYAIARRRGDRVELELVGRVRRPFNELAPDQPDPDAPWSDPTARALYDLVCASPRDDAPRRVLADHLLARDHLRGEAIMLALAGDLDPASIARRDRLFADHERRWLSPLGAVIPMSSARFERGFLVHADVWASKQQHVDAVRGALAWATVESIHLLPGSQDVLDPAMVALREVGPVRSAGLAAIAAAPRPWAIETLHAVVERDQDLAALHAAAARLPRLRRLALSGEKARSALLEAPDAPWWSQLERLTWLSGKKAGGEPTPPVRVPWIARATLGEFHEPAGWELAHGPGGALEISMAGWDHAATIDQLLELVAASPGSGPITLRASRYWSPIEHDLESLRTVTQRPATLAAR